VCHIFYGKHEQMVFLESRHEDTMKTPCDNDCLHPESKKALNRREVNVSILVAALIKSTLTRKFRRVQLNEISPILGDAFPAAIRSSVLISKTRDTGICSGMYYDVAPPHTTTPFFLTIYL
jgi:hypothetical protein